MNKTKYCIIFLFLVTGSCFGQTNSWYINANGSLYQPIGSLNEIFKSTTSGTFSFGKRVEDDLEWEGNIKYINYKKANDEKLFAKGLKHNLEIFDVDLQGKYLFRDLNKNSFIPKLVFGGGISRWVYHRDKYDTLSYNKYKLQFDTINVISPFSQSDWSGNFNFGLELEYIIPNTPVSLLVDLNYYIVIAEIWPALAIRQENISTFQNFNIQFGIRYYFW